MTQQLKDRKRVGKRTHERADLSEERERDREIPLSGPGTDRDVCLNDCASTAVRISTCGEPENVDSLEGLMRQERNLQVSEEANIFDHENRHIEFNGDTREQSTPDEITRLLVNGSLELIGESLSVSDEDHLDINCVGNVFERPRVKCATNVFGPRRWRWVVKVSDSMMWRRSRSLGKPAERSVRQSAA